MVDIFLKKEDFQAQYSGTAKLRLTVSTEDIRQLILPRSEFELKSCLIIKELDVIDMICRDFHVRKELVENDVLYVNILSMHESNYDYYGQYDLPDILKKNTVIFSNNHLEYLAFSSRFIPMDTLNNIEGAYEIELCDCIESQLPGFRGWKTFNELFFVLNRNVSWVVLRNAKFLPNDFWGNDTDVDLLCYSLDNFVKVSYASKRADGISSYQVKINEEYIPFDIRFVGDGYYHRDWQIDMLKNIKFYNGCVPIIKGENYYFSLLYHALLQKKKFKGDYVIELNSLTKDLALVQRKITSINNMISEVNLLNAFLRERGYSYTKPLDFSVYESQYTPMIIKENALGSVNKNVKASLTLRMKIILHKIMPSFIFKLYRLFR